ncbi:hypothetical protein PM082_001948 [Marasmius tenuissimus]|nr:hypothetical protein PM082_015530 [Marasmius tenuissimus]KAJ8077517.1 hypothetical protein PM082_001948 [Marasmius tenuissimus]
MALGKPKATHQFSFPPFPQAPEGTSLTPFGDFKERGIQVQLLGEDDYELDGAGKPTVALSKKHDTDKCKTDAKPRPMKPVQVAVKKADGTIGTRRKEWWEEWEDNDRYRNAVAYNPNEARSDRFHKAAGDFNRNRRWPPMITGVRAQWDQFQLFAGLLSSVPVWNKKRAEDPDVDSDEVDSELEDDDDEYTPPPPKGRATQVGKVDRSLEQESGDKLWNNKTKKRPRPHEPYGKDGKQLGRRPAIVENDDQIKDLIQNAKEEKDDKLVAFLNDPETRVKIYLSSYFRCQGLHYADRNLFIHPKLVSIFLSYILRHGVLPDKEENENIRKAKAVADLALEQLPLTSKLAKAIPDDYNRALSALFEIRKNEKLWQAEPVLRTEAADEQMEETAEEKRDTVTPDAKRVKLSPEKGDTVDGQEVKTGDDIESKAISNDVPMAEAAQQASVLSSSSQADATWGNGSGWGDSDPLSSNNGWGGTSAGDADAWGFSKDSSGAWDAPGNPEEPQWFAEIPTLFPLLGPTTLPMTHRTGIVEWSVRKVKKITPPDISPIAAKPIESTSSELDYGNPFAVESELLRKLYRVEVDPWMGWADSSQEEESVMPRIYETSRGQVVVQSGVFFDGNSKEKVGVGSRKGDDGMEVDSTGPPSHSYTTASGLKPFRAPEDSITVLMQPSGIEHLRVGMGLGGTWVQLLRNGDLDDDLGTGTLAKPKNKGKSSGQRYWYIDELMITLTSYHTV